MNQRDKRGGERKKRERRGGEIVR
jgi:hypothetical protein